MISTLERATGFEDHFAQRIEELRSIGPDSLFELRREGMRMWNLAGWPTHKDEEWKYTPLREAAETPWTISANRLVCAGLSGVQRGVPGRSLLLANGRYIEKEPDSSHRPDERAYGGSLAAALSARTAEGSERAFARAQELIGTIASLSGKLGSSNDERFKHLNTALFVDGALVYVPKGVGVEEPFVISHVAMAAGEHQAVHPRILIILEEGARAKVVEAYSGEGTYFTNALTEIWVGEGAGLEHVRVQDESREAYHIGLVAAHQEANSTLTSYSIQFGAKVGRVDTNVWIEGEHTETRLDGVYVPTGQQIHDNKTRIDHAKPNCHSFEAYKGILSGRAIGVFNGKIFVYEDAQKTDAKQTNQALLLSKTATINTKPQLEIFADDVKCTHGATVGQLREDALFYLRSRGIPEKEARALLVYAFAADVLERITIDEVRATLEQEVYRKLHDETDLEAASIESMGE